MRFFGTWVRGGHDSVGLVVGLGDLKGLFQPKGLCGFVIRVLSSSPGRTLRRLALAGRSAGLLQELLALPSGPSQARGGFALLGRVRDRACSAVAPAAAAGARTLAQPHPRGSGTGAAAGTPGGPSRSFWQRGLSGFACTGVFFRLVSSSRRFPRQRLLVQRSDAEQRQHGACRTTSLSVS